MKNHILTLFIICTLTTISVAQNRKKQDIDAIKAMCGCYEVRFNFAETFSPNPDYEFHENYTSGGLEYVLPVSVDNDKIVLQHLLIVNDTMIIKHWRQDWLYENTDLYTFEKDNTWNYKELAKAEVKGQWTQKVYQVDDSPRYEGSASWVHSDGSDYWESVSDAPLPRREYSKREDYNVMIRRNRQELSEAGWIHEQDNDKVMRSATGEELIAQEKGMNTYSKVAESKCAVAQQWWDVHSAYWADVRIVWDELFAKKETVSIKKKYKNKVLYMKIFKLQDELLSEDSYDSEVARVQIREAIQSFLESDQVLVSSIK